MLIPFPPAPVPAKIEWAIDQPAQVNRSEVTRARRVVLLAAAPRWQAKVTLPEIRGEAAVLDWRAFVVDCDGVANSFRLVACEGPQLAGNPEVRVAGAGQQGFRLRTSGWGAAGLRLKRGQFVTVGEQLLMLTAPVIVDADGQATLSIKPYLRAAPADGAAIEVRLPYAVMSMSDPKNGWAVGIGKTYAVGFDCEESA